MGDATEGLVRRLFDATDRQDVKRCAVWTGTSSALTGRRTTFDELASAFPPFFAALPDAAGTASNQKLLAALKDQGLFRAHRVACRAPP